MLKSSLESSVSSESVKSSETLLHCGLGTGNSLLCGTGAIERWDGRICYVMSVFSFPKS